MYTQYSNNRLDKKSDSKILLQKTQNDTLCNLIYLVEKNLNSHENIILNFQQMNYEVKIFTSLEAFNNFYQNNNFRTALALFIDINLVNKTEKNITYANHTSDTEKHSLPIVITSEKDNLITRLKLLRKGYVNFIQKPIKSAQLSELFNRIGIIKPANAYRILVVDDDPMLLMLLKDTLTDAGMEVCALDCPLKIFEVIDKFNPDVLLLDEHMPDVKGSELASILKNHVEYENIPILFLSGEKNPYQQMNTIKNGGIGFLCKPINEQQLISTITVIANDTWKKKAIQHKLKFSYNEREREHLAVNSHAIVCMTDHDGNIKYVNNKFCQISGYTMSELIGKNHRVLQSGLHSKEFYQEMWGKISHGKTWHGVICNKAKDQSYYWVESTIIPFLDESGRPYQYLSIRTDITELKTKEIALSQQNKIQKIISDVALNLLACQKSEYESLITVILQELAEFIDVEQSQILIYNDDTAELEAKYHWCDTIQHFTKVDFQEIIKAQSSWWKNELLNNGLIKVDNLENLPDEEKSCFKLQNISSLLAIPFSDKNNIRGFLTFNTTNRSHKWSTNQIQLMTTISSIIFSSLLKMKYELKLSQSENLLREAHKIAKMGHWEYDLTSKRRIWSKEIFNILGFSSPIENITEKDIYCNIHPEDLPKVKASFQQAINNSKSDITYRILRPDNEIVYVRELTETINNSFEENAKLIGTMQDITEQVLTEEKLILAQQAAERTSSAKSEFLSCMSHELRTPLNAILGFSQIMQNDSHLAASYKDLNNEVLVAGRHLLTLINDILDLAKIESGQLQLSNELIYLDDLIQECIKLIANLPISENIGIIIKGIHGIELYADRMKLKQVLLNLLSNAVKYNKKEGIVTIVVNNITTDHIKISVTDTGIGIAPQDLSEIFVPFNRLGQEHSDIEGTGIGLAITKQIIEKMGGSILATSTLGVGSTFEIEMKCSKKIEVQNNSQQNDLEISVPNHIKIDNSLEKTILYIEDNISNIKLVTKLLSLRKYINFHTAQTPELGIKLANSLKPDLILLDIRLPNMDGYEILSIFKNNKNLQSTKIIALTAEAMQTAILEGKNAGFDDYLTKPIDIRLFNDKLNHYLYTEKVSPSC